MKNTKTSVAPAEAARRLHRLLFGQDIGVIMATKAFHGGGDISRAEPSPARFHRETPKYYIGEFMEGFGLLCVRFPKSGCRLLTEAEVATLEGSERGVVSALEGLATGKTVIRR
jgi:hypothetical protein